VAAMEAAVIMAAMKLATGYCFNGCYSRHSAVAKTSMTIQLH
jgi:hypothetical protein